MRHLRLLLLGAAALSASGAASFAYMAVGPTREAVAAVDPRTKAKLVAVTEATSLSGFSRSFTGTIAARIQSNLGFRVAGKVIERRFDVGQQVRAGDVILRIDDVDLQLALTGKRTAVLAARATLSQADADEKRYGALVKGGLAASPQRYEQAKAALDTARAQLEAAEADEKMAENAVGYSVLCADVDGTIVNTFVEPGQVVTAGQVVVQLAKAGPREAVISLPENVRPHIGARAEAAIYGTGDTSGQAHLRQISDSAEPATRTYEARFVLEGDAAAAPLGATVTLRLADGDDRAIVAVPIAAVLNDGDRTGVWRVDRVTSKVHFAPVSIKRIGDEIAEVSGINRGDAIVALGTQFLSEDATVRTTSLTGAAR